MRFLGMLLTILALAFTSAGCGKGVKEEEIKVDAANDPLNEPRAILKRYGEGQALGSEVASFPKMVADVRKVDAARADVLEKGLEEIKKAAPSARAALAKDLHKKLSPAMK